MGRPRVDYTDFDEVVVHRVVNGRHPGQPFRPADAGEITRRLATQHRYSDGQIAHALGMTRRSVIRIRARLGIPAALTPRQNNHHLTHDAPSRPVSKG